MAIIRRLVAQDQDENQILKVDSLTRYVVNSGEDCWQFLFGPNSELSTSNQVVKIAAQFNKDNFNSIYFAAYLYNTVSGSADSAASCTFSFYKVNNPNWSETFISSQSGTILPNSYFYLEKLTSDFPTLSFDGGDTIAVEVVMTRLSVTYKDRIYFNHLGIYDNCFRLKQDIDFLDITKLDE